MTRCSGTPEKLSGSEATSTAPIKPAKRAASAYDAPTPEKIAFGRRMREAREIAGMSQFEAADAMGYGQAVQLSIMESGQCLPTARVLMHCAVLYGTTMDFLCGFVQDSDRDPAVTAQREVALRIPADIRRLIATITAGGFPAGGLPWPGGPGGSWRSGRPDRAAVPPGTTAGRCHRRCWRA